MNKQLLHLIGKMLEMARNELSRERDRVEALPICDSSLNKETGLICTELITLIYRIELLSRGWE